MASRITKAVTKYLNPIVNKRQAENSEPPAITDGLSPSKISETQLSEPTDVAVSAQAVADDPESALIPDEAIFAGRDPSFRSCTTIDDLKQACGCFLDFKRVPKIVVKTVTRTS